METLQNEEKITQSFRSFKHILKIGFTFLEKLPNNTLCNKLCYHAPKANNKPKVFQFD